jgi:predicted TIM-barrel fold metal-dependent hydrolase
MTRSDRSASTTSVFDFAGHVHLDTVTPDTVTRLDAFVGDHHSDLETLIRWYDTAGVDGAALSQPFFMGHGDADAVAEANDALLDRIDGYPAFHGLAAIPTAAGGEAAADELKRCLDAGYRGGALETKSDGIELVDADVEPVLEAANRTGVPLLVHPKLNDSLHPEVLDDSYRLNAIFGREAALCESLSKVIHDGVFERYPNLTLVYHHCGGNIASMIGRVQGQLDPGRWPGQEHVVPYEKFEETLRERVYIDTCGFFGHPGPLRDALELFPTSHVLFGTDTPYEARSHEEYREYISTVRATADADATQQILGENARQLL